ncbi:GH10141 [Drosophila grimshawi]|uniref:GH10141 n=1 Tax=Drosophila grimshawi TaxID=7222 RepID=B4JCB3_DROGR|nr:GH10141 [Drosophila grimshawi]
MSLLTVTLRVLDILSTIFGCNIYKFVPSRGKFVRRRKLQLLVTLLHWIWLRPFLILVFCLHIYFFTLRFLIIVTGGTDDSALMMMYFLGFLILKFTNIFTTISTTYIYKYRRQQTESVLNEGGNSRPGLLHTLMPNPLADLPLLAPMGCDQYFRGSTGGIVSFNFAGGAYMPNMKYVICVAGGANQQITYSIEHFALSKSSGAPGAGYDSDCHSTVSTWGRASDYLLIPNSYVANNQAIQATYYCGTGLAGTKIIARPPFVLHFSSDGQTSATETGFQLTYTVQQSQALL